MSGFDYEPAEELSENCEENSVKNVKNKWKFYVRSYIILPHKKIENKCNT